MKSTKEIIGLLVSELIDHFDGVKSINRNLIYYNKILGDTSFLLAGLLDSILKKNYREWDNGKWIDDSLITKIMVKDNDLKIDGVMIWGRKNTTEQWIDPFFFEISLLKEEASCKKFFFLFSDLDNPEITYEEYRDDRDYWTASDRNWKYTIHSDDLNIRK